MALGRARQQKPFEHRRAQDAALHVREDAEALVGGLLRQGFVGLAPVTEENADDMQQGGDTRWQRPVLLGPILWGAFNGWRRLVHKQCVKIVS